MARDTERLKRLARAQKTLKAYHEMRHAILAAQAQAAAAEADDLMRRKDGEASLATVFPEVYERGIAQALQRRDRLEEEARAAVPRIVTETLRSSVADRNLRDARRDDERDKAEKDVLEAIEQRLAPRR